MAHISVSAVLEAPPAAVWQDISNIASHTQWMQDAQEITFTSGQQQGVGTTFDCQTKVGPFRLLDQMEITEWVENSVIGVRHCGLIVGDGRFRLTPIGNNETRIEWSEALKFPWWLGGPLTAKLASPILRRIWKKNLELLQKRKPLWERQVG